MESRTRDGLNQDAQLEFEEVEPDQIREKLPFDTAQIWLVYALIGPNSRYKIGPVFRIPRMQIPEIFRHSLSGMTFDDREEAARDLLYYVQLRNEGNMDEAIRHSLEDDLKDLRG